MAARRVSKALGRSRKTRGQKAGARKASKRVARGKRKTGAKKKGARTTRARKSPRKAARTVERTRVGRAAPAAAAIDPFNGDEPDADEMLDGLDDMPSDIDDLIDEDSFNDDDNFNS